MDGDPCFGVEIGGGIVVGIIRTLSRTRSVYGRKITRARADRDGRRIGAVDARSELQPLARELLILAFTFLAPAARELLAFCRVGAEFFTHFHGDLPWARQFP